MKTMWKRLTAAALLTLCVGMLAGCGGEDRVGVVDLERVRKEAPLVQKYKEKTEESKVRNGGIAEGAEHDVG